jgi:hypothetical protein
LAQPEKTFGCSRHSDALDADSACDSGAVALVMMPMDEHLDAHGAGNVAEDW